MKSNQKRFSFKWMYCSCSGGVNNTAFYASSNQAPVKYTKPNTTDYNFDNHHREVMNRALALYQSGNITKEEYGQLLEADLKYQNHRVCMEDSTEHVKPNSRRNKIESPSSFRPTAGTPSTSKALTEKEKEKEKVKEKEKEHKPTVAIETQAYVAQFQKPTDPISLEPLGEHTFVFRTPCGKKISYNIDSLIGYFSSTGDFSDPITRLPLSVADIKSIDRYVARHKLKHPSLYEDIYNKKERFYNMKLKSDELKNLEVCMGDIILDILKIIEQPLCTDEMDIQLSMLLSEFEMPFEAMKRINMEVAYHSLLTWKTFLKGPPKKPTKNNRKLRSAIKYLDMQLSVEDRNVVTELRSSGAKDIPHTSREASSSAASPTEDCIGVDATDVDISLTIP